jgi:hypothetical protein
MVAVNEFSWEEISAPDFGSTDRQAFRQAVAAVAASAKEKLPESNGRVEKAVALVLAGDVVLGEQHTALVYSQADADTSYAVRPGFCSCKDFDQAPGQLCKHRIAAAMLRRALDTTQPQPPARQPLPEAPASVNCHVTIGGRDVQVTLRDSDETRLLQRLEAVLALYPVTQAAPAPPVQPSAPAAQPTPEGWCIVHGVQMMKQTNQRGSWWSHKAADGAWCKGK